MSHKFFEDVELINTAFGVHEEEELEGPDLNKPIFKLMPDKAQAIRDGKCPMCDKKIDKKEFKDADSKVEYTTSGMCQECQDKTFK